VTGVSGPKSTRLATNAPLWARSAAHRRSWGEDLAAPVSRDGSTQQCPSEAAATATCAPAAGRQGIRQHLIHPRGCWRRPSHRTGDTERTCRDDVLKNRRKVVAFAIPGPGDDVMRLTYDSQVNLNTSKHPVVVDLRRHAGRGQGHDRLFYTGVITLWTSVGSAARIGDI
jgi:hypothetical protein